MSIILRAAKSMGYLMNRIYQLVSAYYRLGSVKAEVQADKGPGKEARQRAMAQGLRGRWEASSLIKGRAFFGWPESSKASARR